MANVCTTLYKVRGGEKEVNNLWEKLQTLGVNEKSVWLCDLAEAYGIDLKKKEINVRGQIFRAELEQTEETGDYILTFETETAWCACTELFEHISEAIGDDISFSYREIEPGMQIYTVHDEWNFFPEECFVDADGEPFESIYEEPFDTISEAINLWVSLTGIAQGERTEEEMVEFINIYDYEDEDTYFYINPIKFI